MADPKNINIWGVIPAAGISRRMGFPKQSAKIDGVTMAATVAQNMLASGVQGIVVATRSELSSALELPDDSRIRIVINDDPTSQMLDSIRIAVATLSNPPVDGVMVVPSDMPGISASTYRTCVEIYRKHSARIIIATHNDVRGHPIVIPLSMRQELDSLNDGLRDLAKRFTDRVLLVETTDAAVLKDVDTPRDFESL